MSALADDLTASLSKRPAAIWPQAGVRPPSRPQRLVSSIQGTFILASWRAGARPLPSFTDSIKLPFVNDSFHQLRILASDPLPTQDKGMPIGCFGPCWSPRPKLGRYPYRRLNARSKIANNASGLKGLIRKSFMPAARHCALSSAKALAVMAIIGMS